MSLFNLFDEPSKNGATKRRWVVLSWLFFLTAINYLDRTNMAVAAPAMSQELGLNAAAMGLLFSAFSWSYGLCQIPGGWFLDRFGARLTYGLSLFFWSLFTVFMGFGYSFISLFLIRLLVGIAESPAFPTNSRVASIWFPSTERGTATAIYTSGEFVGLAFLTPLLTYILHAYGWEEVFYFTGIIGIIVAVLWYAFYRDPNECKNMNDIERTYIRDGGGLVDMQPKKSRVTWAMTKELLSHRQLLGLYLTQFANTSTMFFFLTWFPTYLITEKNMPILKAGAYAAIPYIGALCGVLIGGYWSDKMIKEEKSLSKARKTPVVIGLIISMSIFLANYANSPELVISIMAIAFFGQGMAATIWSTIGDVAPVESVGLAGGMFNFIGNMAGIMTPIVIGLIVQSTGSFVMAIAFVAFIAAIGVFSILFVVGDMKRIISKNYKQTSIET